jgi:hypothetical protein
MRTTAVKWGVEGRNAGDEALSVLVGLGFDGGELFGIGAQRVGHAAGAFDAHKFHAGEAGSVDQSLHEGGEIGGFGACGGEERGAGTRGEREQELLSLQGIAAGAVREAVGPHFFHPALEQGGDVEPEKGELQHDNAGAAQTILLCGDVNGLVGVERVEAEHFGIGEMVLEVVENAEIGGGVVKIGVAADDEGVWHECVG